MKNKIKTCEEYVMDQFYTLQKELDHANELLEKNYYKIQELNSLVERLEENIQILEEENKALKENKKD